MKFLYISRTRRIKELRPESKQIILSKLECRLIEVLSNGCVNTWREIGEYVYGCYDKYIYLSLINVKKRLLKRINLNIKCCTGVRS